MKKTLWIITCALLAQMASAQTPKWAANAKKAIFSIVTYDKDNNIKATGNGFYIDNKGTALSDYSLFEGATRAVIIDANGKQQPVEMILGANSMYDVVKFKTPVDKKQVSLKVATQPAKNGDAVFLMPYSTQKEALCQRGAVVSADSIGKHFLLRYVTISPISLPSFLPRYSTAPASMSPERVPMITPSRGVKPIVVSTHLPAFTADKLLPLPRWQTMIFALGLPRYFATSVETNLWLVPWKPYLRTLNFS